MDIFKATTGMGGLERLIESDPRVVGLAAHAGRLLIENTIAARGLPPEAAADVADEVVRDLAESPTLATELDDNDVRSLLDDLRQRTRQLREESAERVKLFDQLESFGDVEPFGSGSRKSTLSRVALALIIHLNVTPVFTFRTDATGTSFEISNRSLVIEIIDRVATSVDRAVEAWTQVHEKPLGTQVSQGPSAAEGGPSRAEHGRSAPAVRTELDIERLGLWLGGADHDVALRRLLEGQLDDLGNHHFGIRNREDAVAVTDLACDMLNERAAALELPDDQSRRLFKGGQHGEWKHAPFVFNVGLRPTRLPDNDAVLTYRIAIRVQTLRGFRKEAWTHLKKALNTSFRGVTSIRPSREVTALVASPSVPWPRGAVSHGHGISVRDGQAGTICTFVIDGHQQCYAVTAGHVVSRLGQQPAPQGQEAFSPPFADPTDIPIGKVHEAHLIRRPWISGNPHPGQPVESDFAAVRLEELHNVADSAARRADGVRALQARTVAVGDNECANRIEVVKSTSRTAQCRGRLFSIDSRVVVTYPDTNRTVLAVGLLEIELLGARAAPGESGTAVHTMGGELIGMIVAGSDQAQNPEDPKDKYAPIVYVQPLHDLLAARSWKVY